MPWLSVGESALPCSLLALWNFFAMLYRHLAIILSLLIAPPAAFGVTVVLNASKDNTLYESSTGSVSNGQGDYLYVGKTGVRDGFNLRRGLIAFDLTSIPADATVTGVTLSLFVSKTSPNPAAQTVNISLHLAAQNWGEGLSDADSVGGGPGAPAQSGDATWLHTFHNTGLWATAGGDFPSTPSATTAVTLLSEMRGFCSLGCRCARSAVGAGAV